MLPMWHIELFVQILTGVSNTYILLIPLPEILIHLKSSKTRNCCQRLKHLKRYTKTIIKLFHFSKTVNNYQSRYYSLQSCEEYLRTFGMWIHNGSIVRRLVIVHSKFLHSGWLYLIKNKRSYRFVYDLKKTTFRYFKRIRYNTLNVLNEKL